MLKLMSSLMLFLCLSVQAQDIKPLSFAGKFDFEPGQSVSLKGTKKEELTFKGKENRFFTLTISDKKVGTLVIKEKETDAGVEVDLGELEVLKEDDPKKIIKEDDKVIINSVGFSRSTKSGQSVHMLIADVTDVPSYKEKVVKDLEVEEVDPKTLQKKKYLIDATAVSYNAYPMITFYEAKLGKLKPLGVIEGESFKVTYNKDVKNIRPVK